MRDSNFYNIIQNNKWAFERKNVTVLYEDCEPVELWYLMVYFNELKINQIQLIEPMYDTTIYNMITIRTIPNTFNEFADIVGYEGNEAESLYPDELSDIINNSGLFIKFCTEQNPLIYLEDNVGYMKAIYGRDGIIEWDYYFPKPKKIDFQNSCIKFKKRDLNMELHFNHKDVALKILNLKDEGDIVFEPRWSNTFLKGIEELLGQNVKA